MAPSPDLASLRASEMEEMPEMLETLESSVKASKRLSSGLPEPMPCFRKFGEEAGSLEGERSIFLSPSGMEETGPKLPVSALG